MLTKADGQRERRQKEERKCGTLATKSATPSQISVSKVGTVRNIGPWERVILSGGEEREGKLVVQRINL